jgi:hypothetical protein
VDDAIVVVENVERFIRQGLTPREATLVAMREVSGPVVAVALVLGAVFIPTAFLPGITGQFYRQFASPSRCRRSFPRSIPSRSALRSAPSCCPPMEARRIA